MKIKTVWFENLVDIEIKNLQKVKFPIRIGYHIKTVVQELREKSKAYFDQKQEILKEHSDEDDKLKPEEQHIAIRKITELCEIETDVNIIPMKISINDLPDMSVSQLEFIEPFFDITMEK